MARLVSLVIVSLVLALAVVACGGDDDEAGGTETTTTEETTTEETTTEETTTEAGAAEGREVFVANCGSCHTLSDAGTSGQIGPNLDSIGLDGAAVEEQVRNGGGGMPAFEGQLSDDEISQVSAYVAANDGS
jgi:mono/diheme cytochrome c family protein